MKVKLKEFYYLENQYSRMLNNFNMRAFRNMSNAQVFSSICCVTVSIIFATSLSIYRMARGFSDPHILQL
jgi:amino acid permease